MQMMTEGEDGGRHFFKCPRAWVTLRVRLDVDIGGLGIELVPIPNQTNIGNEMQYQISCLDTNKISMLKLRTSLHPSHGSTERDKGREGSGFAGRRCSKAGWPPLVASAPGQEGWGRSPHAAAAQGRAGLLRLPLLRDRRGGARPPPATVATVGAGIRRLPLLQAALRWRDWRRETGEMRERRRTGGGRGTAPAARKRWRGAGHEEDE